MWLRRKAQNKRLGREYVLDVKLRSSQVRATRTRMMAVTAGVLFGIGVVLFAICWLGNLALDEFVYRNPAFGVQQVDLQTDGVISLEQLRRWAGVKAGDNLLALDLSAVKRRLEMNPWIQTVSVERIVPRTLRIRVSEREPLAQIVGKRVRTGGDIQPVTYQLDSQGCVMLPLEPQQRSIQTIPGTDQLPAITGVKVEEIQPGRFLNSQQMRAALGLVDAFDRSQMGSFIDLKKIDISSAGVLVATTGQGAQVTFGLVDVDQQLRRWHEIYETGQRIGKALSSVDLAVSNNIPAQWVEASAVPPSPPKLPKAWRTKRKHV
jgi:cell division septal protein FtsQ